MANTHMRRNAMARLRLMGGGGWGRECIAYEDVEIKEEVG